MHQISPLVVSIWFKGSICFLFSDRLHVLIAQATALSMGNNHEYDMAAKVEKV